MGASIEGDIGYGIVLDSNSILGITGVEVYVSTEENGTYTLEKTVPKENLYEYKENTVDVVVQKGQHLYYKVRTYVKNSAGTYYSDYSNIIEADNSN